MKIYEIYLCDNTHYHIKTLKFNSPISKKDLDKYFLEDENLYRICCCNKKGLNIYTLYKDKTFTLRIYNKENKEVYSQWYDGKIYYPYGKEIYLKHINKYKLKKLNKILNE